MTTPASPEPVERCPDCGRPKSKCEHCVGGSELRHDAWRKSQCQAVTITRLRSELASVRALSDAERAVVEALVAERYARDAIPGFTRQEGEFPPQPFWDGARKLEAAHLVTEKALDALLALRKDQTDGD